MKLKKILIPAYHYLWGGGIMQINHILYHLSFLEENEYQFYVIHKKTSLLAEWSLWFKKNVKKYLLNRNEDYISCQKLLKRNKLYIQDKKFFHFKSIKKDSEVLEIIENNKIDCVFPASDSFIGNTRKDIKKISFLIDFRHRNHPEQFRKEEYNSIENAIVNFIKCSDCFFFLSEFTQNDALKFYGIPKDKGMVIPFTPCFIPFSGRNLRGTKRLFKKYGIHQPYFMVSNQLQFSKNHIVVIKALTLLKNENICMVFTGGYKKGYDDSLTFLNEKIEEYGLKERILITGYIDELSHLTLMKNSIALIQPTLSEGNPGGMSVMNAISLGVPVILSNIEVNKEVKGQRLTFFDPYNENELADIMVNAIKENKKNNQAPPQTDPQQLRNFYSKLFS